MNHLLILPILVPLSCACLLLMIRDAGAMTARGLALLSSLAQLALAGLLLAQSSTGAIQLYTVGHWLPPHGIVLVLDRLAALMLFTTAVLALPALLYACTGIDRRGKYFHVLFQFQLMGVNGAFLTGDLFNLFVFFEVLLMASYGLLLHGQGAARLRAGLQYVVLNLVGSALFLIAAGIFYGLAGTLNLADLSVFIAVAEPGDAPLLAAAGSIAIRCIRFKSRAISLVFLAAAQLCGGQRAGRCIICDYEQNRHLRYFAFAAFIIWRACRRAGGFIIDMVATSGFGNVNTRLAWCVGGNHIDGVDRVLRGGVGRYFAQRVGAQLDRGTDCAAVLPVTKYLDNRRDVFIGGFNRRSARRCARKFAKWSETKKSYVAGQCFLNRCRGVSRPTAVGGLYR